MTRAAWRQALSRFMAPPTPQQAPPTGDLLDRLFGPDDGHPVTNPAVPDEQWEAS